MIEMRPMEGSSEPLNIDELLKQGWQYQDHPQMLAPYWKYLLKGYGE